MGCPYPIKVKNPNYKNNGIHKWERELYYFVPCGQCLECMKSKRSWLTDVCNFEHNKYGIGSFTTLTYDDENIVLDGTRAVLRYKDFQDFNKRLRENLEKKYTERVKYSFICVGEYGTVNERPHMHILFFGLDWQKDDKIITESWNKGIVQNMPIKRGGISYVLKYLDKDRIRNNKHYNQNKDLRPFLKHSVGIANDFIKAHYKEIIKYNGCYTMDNGQTLKPIPSYYVRKLLIYKPLDLSRIKQKMLDEHWKDKKDIKEYNKTEVMEYIMIKSKEEYEKIIRVSRANGEPQQDFDNFYYETRKKEIL